MAREGGLNLSARFPEVPPTPDGAPPIEHMTDKERSASGAIAQRKPVFSILSPVFNSSAFVRRSYYTLKSQSFTDWEWIVVDDGSTDNTVEVVNAISDPRIRLFSYTPNRGRGHARNLALDASRGDWMVVWDIDDMYFPDRLERINRARLEGFDFCCSYAVVVDNDLVIKGVRGFHPRSPGLPRYFVHPTLACRLSVAREIGYDPAFRIGEDAPLTWGLDDNYRGCFIEEALMIYQEEREANVEKALASNVMHLVQIRRLYRRGMIKAGLIGRLALLAKWNLKQLALRLMRMVPRLYRVTLSFRSYGVTARNWRLSPERVAFLEDLRSRTGLS
ncbi:MAG: glycosyltransferase [Betaproteobacteria bacterium]|nr:glycosyltransferase [Betaproteobacteria bacterium]